MDEIQHSGRWWLPNNPGETFPGRLHLTNHTRPRLDLDGVFEQPPPDMVSLPVDVINGTTTDGQRFAVLNSTRVAGTLVTWGEASGHSTYSSTYAIQGINLSTGDDLRIDAVDVLFDNMGEWARISGFRHEIKNPEGSDRLLTLHYETPNYKEAQVEGGGLEVAPSMWWSRLSFGHWDLQEKLFWRIRLTPPLPIKQALDNFVTPLQQFLTIGVGRAVYPTEIAVRLHESTRVDHRSRGAFLDLWYAMKPRVERDPIEAPFMLFSLGTITQEYPDPIEQWFSVREDLQPVLGQYFATLFAPEMSRSTRFLNLAQALEVYHRTRFGGHIMDPDEFELLLSKLDKELSCRSLARPVRQVLAGRVQFWNEMSFSSRMKDLVGKLSGLGGPLTGKPRLFARRMTDTRNFLTHYNPALAKRASSGQDLYFLAEAARFVLEAHLLEEVGLSEQKRRDILEDNQRYLRVLAELRRWTGTK